MKITDSNIDDIIREEKRKYHSIKGVPLLTFHWGKDGFNSLRKFVSANLPCSHGWFCLCGDGESIIDKLMFQGFTYMGAMHYWDRRKTGYNLIVNNK